MPGVVVAVAALLGRGPLRDFAVHRVRIRNNENLSAGRTTRASGQGSWQKELGDLESVVVWDLKGLGQ